MPFRLPLPFTPPDSSHIIDIIDKLMNDRAARREFNHSYERTHPDQVHHRNVSELPAFLMKAIQPQYGGSGTTPLFGGPTPYQRHIEDLDLVSEKPPTSPAGPDIKSMAASTYAPVFPQSILGASVDGPGISHPAKKVVAAPTKAAPTGMYAGNRQDSIVPAQPTVDLSALNGAIQKPSMDDLSPAPIEARGGLGQGMLVNVGDGGSQFSVPKNNLFKTILSRMI